MANLKSEVNPNITRFFIRIFCTVGIIHETILALSRLDLPFTLPGQIFLIIGNNYSNNIISDVIALIFRLAILGAVVWASAQKKRLKNRTKSLMYVKILRMLLMCFWLYMIVFNMDMFSSGWSIQKAVFDYMRNYGQPILIALEVLLFMLLILRTKTKIQTIFILGLMAMLIDTFIFQISNYLFRYTPQDWDGSLYLIVGVLYIISFIKALSLVKIKIRGEKWQIIIRKIN